MNKLEQYALARDNGWQPGDEDTAQEFCETEGLTQADLGEDTVNDWRSEYNASHILDAYKTLHDGLSNMIEGGRLKECDIPDDYQWLSDSLEKIAAMEA